VPAVGPAAPPSVFRRERGRPWIYYQVLGVDRKAAAADIKRPTAGWPANTILTSTRATNRPKAKVQGIQEAYSVLSDAKKKSQYDQFGFAGDHPPGGGAGPYPGGGGFDGFDFFRHRVGSFRDFFENVFSGGTAASARPGNRRAAERGET